MGSSAHSSWIRSVLGGLIAAAALLVVACAGGDAPAVSQAPQQPAPAAPPAAVAAPTTPSASKTGEALADGPKYGGTLNHFMRRDLRGGFDPHLPPGGRRETRTAMGVAYEMLAGWDTTPENQCASILTPWLAESWKWVDPTTLEISLHKGVKFHNKPPVNGREMVADDVLFSFQRIFDKGLKPALRDNLVSLEAPDKYTVRIKLAEPSPLLPADLLANRWGVILAKEAETADGSYSTLETAIGTGPFILEISIPAVRVEAVRNPNYWIEGLPYIDRVVLRIIRDTSTRIAALQVGKLDIYDELSTAIKQQILSTNPDIQWVDCETGTNYTLIFNNQQPPFDNVLVRRAVSMAINREAIVHGLYRGEGSPVAMFGASVDGALPLADFPAETRKHLQYNPEAAKKLLAEAGFPKGFSLKMFGGSHQPPPYSELHEALIPMLKAIGIDAKLGLVEAAEFQVNISSWKYGQVAFTKGNPSNRSPIEVYLAGFHSSESPTTNRSHVQDPETDRLIEKMMKTVDAKARLEVARLLQLRLADQANFVVLPLFMDPRAYQPWIKGELKSNSAFWLNQSGWRYREMWIDK